MATVTFKRVTADFVPLKSGIVSAIFGNSPIESAASYTRRDLGRYVRFIDKQRAVFVSHPLDAHGVIESIEKGLTVNGGYVFGSVRLQLTVSFEELMHTLPD